MAKFSYKRAWGPPGSFIHDYCSSLSGQETAHSYDFWSAVWAIGAACGRGVYVDRPRAPVHSAWYIILVAESGVTRKSTAVRVITDIVRPICPPPVAVWFEGKSTPEALEQRLHDNTEEAGHARCIISVSELVTFFGKENYTMAMPGLLTDLYDAPQDRVTGGSLYRGRMVLKNVHVSFLSASTPTWLAGAINQDVVEGGFTSRCLFIHSEERKKKIPWSIVDPDAATTDDLIRNLDDTATCAQSVGPYLLSDGAMKRFSRWYKARSPATAPYLRSFESREDAHVLRLAMCMAINERQDMIGADHINRAVKVISHEKGIASRLFEGGVRPDNLVRATNKMINIIRQRGESGVPQSMISTRVRHLISMNEMSLVLDIMNELQMIEGFVDVRTGVGRRATIWRGTSNLSNPETYQSLITELTE